MEEKIVTKFGGVLHLLDTTKVTVYFKKSAFPHIFYVHTWNFKTFFPVSINFEKNMNTETHHSLTPQKFTNSDDVFSRTYGKMNTKYLKKLGNTLQAILYTIPLRG